MTDLDAWGHAWESTLGRAQRAPLEIFIPALLLMLEDAPPPPGAPPQPAPAPDAATLGPVLRAALGALELDELGRQMVTKSAFQALVARFGPLPLLVSRIADLAPDGDALRPWFHGETSRADAVRALREAKAGAPCCLVRFSQSAPTQLCLSILSPGGKVKHSLVRNAGAGGYSLDGVAGAFPTLSALLADVGLPAAPTPLRLRCVLAPRQQAEAFLRGEEEPLDAPLRAALDALVNESSLAARTVLGAALAAVTEGALAAALGVPEAAVAASGLLALLNEAAPPVPPAELPHTPPPPAPLAVPRTPPRCRSPAEQPEFRSYVDLAAGYDVLPLDPAPAPGICFSPFGPAALAPGQSADVAVWVCALAGRDALLARLREQHELAPPATAGACALGQLVTVMLAVGAPLSLGGEGCRSVAWEGEPASADFVVHAPAGAEPGAVPCTATVLVGRDSFAVDFALRVGFDSVEKRPLEATTRHTVDAELPVVAADRLEYVKELGRGMSATAHLARMRGVGHVVVKEFHHAPAREAEFLNECRVLRLVGRHVNVVECLGVVGGRGNAIVLEHCAGGSLDDALRSSSSSSSSADGRRPVEWAGGDDDAGARFGRAARVRMARDAARGLAALHSAAVVHGDVALRNALLHEDGRVCISDFGLASVRPANAAEGTRFCESAWGPLRWMAPEQLQPPFRSSFKSDVWAAGVLTWEVLSGRLPFDDCADGAEAAARVLRGERPPVPGDWPAPLRGLLGRCFAAEPEGRPSAVQLAVELEGCVGGV